MNKKAFTLTELIGVITILGLIAIIAFPPLLKQIKGTQSKIDEATEKLIIVGASNYVDENKNNFPKISGNSYCVTLQTLVDDNKVSNDLVDSKGNKLDLSKYIKVGISDNQYTYDIVDSCTSLAIGDEVYYNPVENAICDKDTEYTPENSATGVKTGCMRWYVYKMSGNQVGLILDHNTTGKVAWITADEYNEVDKGSGKDLNSYGPLHLNKVLKADTEDQGWKVKADIVDALDIVKFIPYFKELDDITTWESYIEDYLTLHVTASNDALANASQSEYNTIDEYIDTAIDYVEENHPNVTLPRVLYRDLFYETTTEQMTGTTASTYGYWTKTATSIYSNSAWIVNDAGSVNSYDVTDDVFYGVRPVITLSKSLLSK